MQKTSTEFSPSVQVVPVAAVMEAREVQPMQTMDLSYVKEGRWSTPMCAFWHDCCSCWATICCFELVTAQMCTRTFKDHKTKALVFIALFALIVLVRVLPMVAFFELQNAVVATVQSSYQISASAYSHYQYGHPEDLDYGAAASVYQNIIWQYVGFVCFCLVLAVVIWLAIIVVRYKIRARYNIPETFCPGSCDDCCFAWMYPQCTLMQMMRHERLTGGRYNLCSIDGEGCCV